MKKIIAAAALTLATIGAANAGESYEGQVFETRGIPTMVTEGWLTVTNEKFPRPLAQYIQVSSTNAFAGLKVRRPSGWTYCEVPAGQKKTVVFECRVAN